MELRKFKEKNHKKVGIVIFTLVCILLISGVILYRTFAIFQVDTTQNVINGSIEDPGDIYFAFYKKDENGEFKIQKEMPQKEEGYMLDKQSFCGVNGNKDDKIIPSLDRDTWSIVVTGVTTSRTKCNLYFTKTYDDTTLYDLSGNNYNGTFQNGSVVQKDEEGNLGIYFDGTDDFVDVADLPESIDFANGFLVEGEFKALSNEKWVRIYDFGVGGNNNNIVATFVNNKLRLSIRYDSQTRDNDYNDFIELSKKIQFKIDYKKIDNGYIERVEKDNCYYGSHIYEVENFTKNILRTSNFLGMSNFVGEFNDRFHGYIYSLKFTDSKNNIILWYDF